VNGAPSFLEPGTRDELAEMVRAAMRDRIPLRVTGRAQPSGPIAAGARVISTRHLDRVIAHEPGDLTLTAECGVSVAGAQSLVSVHRQLVALDPPDPTSSIGSVIAASLDGPIAALFGAVRDQVLGLTVVNGDGRLTRCGGRVVKNVTGYDLCRLYTGSGGGLGILVDATVRLRPAPERVVRIEAEFPAWSEAFEKAWSLRNRVPEIAAIQIRGGSGPECAVVAIAAGPGSFVEAAAAEIRAALGRSVREAPGDARSFRIIAPPQDAHGVTIAAPPASWRELAARLDPLLAPQLECVHDVLRGVRESWHAQDRPWCRDERALDGLLAKSGATLDCPGDAAFPATVLQRFPGQRPGGLELMRRLKAALDPHGILNAGMTIYG
jgi:FAD/FMN-containing dehydrogenase